MLTTAECHRCKGVGWIVAADIQAMAEQLRAAMDEIENLVGRLHGAELANRGIPIVPHVELNGHIDVAEQLHDYLLHESSNDPTGKIQDFAESLAVVVEQCDLQRRQRNWFEAAYEAGKLKLVESRVEKTLAPIRDAARRLVSLVDDMGAVADDSDPRMIALAGPIGEAQAKLYQTLGLDLDEEHARLVADIDSRCAVCGFALADSVKQGCVRGSCSYRPRPTTLYAPARAEREAAERTKP